MKIVPYFWLLLCLVVDTNARSVKSTHDEPGVEVVSRLQSDIAEDESEDVCAVRRNIDVCTEQKKVCKRDDMESEGFRCVCREGDVEKEDGECIENPCNSNPCQNAGTCEWIASEYSACTCIERFEGKFCEIEKCKLAEIEVCGTVPCVYNGTSELAFCVCEEGEWFDPKSKTCKENPCNPNPCKNDGVCRWFGSESFTCSCTERYEGETCEKQTCTLAEIEDCGTATCVYKENSDKGECVCEEGEWFDPTSKTCQNVCSPNPCRNGGVCNATKGSVTCQCKDHFVGADCSLDVCSPNPCRNGGVCNATKGRVTCQCKEHFVGADCSLEIFPSTSTSNTTLESTGFSTHRPTVSKTNKTTPRFNSTIAPDFTTKNSSEGHLFNFTSGTTNTFFWTTLMPTTDTVNTDFVTNGTTHPFLRTTLMPTTDTDVCAQNRCQNGGTCLVVGNRSKCLCRKPYLGILCETDPCDWNPCKNGGMCKVENENVKCFCKEPFTGEFCESRIKIDAYVITLVAVSLFLAIVLIFVTCVLCQKYHVVKN